MRNPLQPAVRRLRASGLPPDVFAMSGVSMSVALGFGVVGPAIPLFASQFGVDAAAAGAVVSAFALMRLVADPGAGWLVNRTGERRGLMLGLVVVAVSSVFAGLAQDYEQLLVLRGVGGIGSAVFGVSAVSLVMRVATPRTRGQAMSVYRSGFVLGGILGPAVGGAVLGISLRAPFFGYAATLVMAAAVVVVFVRRPEAMDDPAPSPPAQQPGEAAAASRPGPEPGVRALLRTREYQAALVANLSVGLAVFGLRTTIVPLFFVKVLDTSNSTVAYAFLVSAVVQVVLMLPAGRFSDTVGRRPSLLVGTSVSALSMVLLAVSGSLWLALVALAVFGAGSTSLGSAPAALVGDVAGRRSGSVFALFNMASDFGQVVGPTVAGVLVDQGSYPMAFGLGAAVMVVSGLLALRLPAGPSRRDAADVVAGDVPGG